MNIFLTGGSGFIGKNILDSFLSKKYTIFAPSHDELDLLDDEQLSCFFDTHDIDLVIHAASKPGHRKIADISAVFYTNTRIFFNLIKHQKKFKKMIKMGSGAIYDMRHYQPKMKESYFGEHIPDDSHGFCQYVCGKHIENHSNIIDLRLFGVFGKYEDYTIRFISNMICKALFDLPLTIKQNRYFDYVYIDDLIKIIDFFICNDTPYNAYNITPNQSVSLVWLAEQVLSVTKKDSPIILETTAQGLDYSGCNARFRLLLPSFTFIPFANSIKDLYNWYYNHQEKIKPSYLKKNY